MTTTTRGSSSCNSSDDTDADMSPTRQRTERNRKNNIVRGRVTVSSGERNERNQRNAVFGTVGIVSFVLLFVSNGIDVVSQFEWITKTKEDINNVRVRIISSHTNASLNGSSVGYISLNLPDKLFGTIYHSGDFINERGIVAPFWNQSFSFRSGKKKTPSWGPCYESHKSIDWQNAIDQYNQYTRTHHPLVGNDSLSSSSHNEDDEQEQEGEKEEIEPHYNPKLEQLDLWNLQDYCRPGFLIIGQGKCGTSSLYHYLVDGHPRVLPAKQKQIHYFKYFKKMPLTWYYDYFPDTESFLSTGAMMTGEASPGYIPYPDVPATIADKMGRTPGQRPKIILLGRDPIDRAYSSYRYNYRDPTIKRMKAGRAFGIAHGKSDDYYESLLFSFEEMVRAELQTLRECFQQPGGIGFVGAKRKWSKNRYYSKEYTRREQLGIRPLVDLDGFCYGDRVSLKLLRKQWTNLTNDNPDKVILNQNLHLVQAMLGRSLYLFPLEWWYLVFHPSEIYFLCTEEMKDLTGEPLNQLALWLGLPRFDGFANVVQKGVYNAGDARGYDTEVSWEELHREQDQNYVNTTTTSTTPTQQQSQQQASSKSVPLSPELLQELKDFFRPYNEQLFQLTGRTCPWNY